VAIVLLQLGVGAAMVLFALPGPLQAAHVAVGAGVWAVLVWVVCGSAPDVR
jgi:heme A synthase